MIKRTQSKRTNAPSSTDTAGLKKSQVVISITQVFRNLSISVNLTVYSIYLIYLIYSIFANVGIKTVNFALACATAAFMAVYLVLRLSGKRRGRQLKMIKHYYKNFKLIARGLSAIVAIYALITSVGSVSPMAMILSLLGLVFVIIKLIVELILGLIRRKLRKMTGKTADTADDGDDDEEVAPRRRKLTRTERRKRRRNKTNKEIIDEMIEEIIIPVDACLLSDIDE